MRSSWTETGRALAAAMVAALTVGVCASTLTGCDPDPAAVQPDGSQPGPAGHSSVTVPAATKVHAAHILVSYQGANMAKATLTRTKEEARKRADEIRTMALADGADFAALAKQYSDGPSGPKGGSLGVFGRGAMVPAFETTAFALPIDGVSGLVETKFGFHVIKRLALPAEAVTQHIMVQWKGAKRALGTVTRSKDEARQRAQQAQAEAAAPGADWFAMVAKYTDDPGTKNTGGLAGRLTTGGVAPDFIALGNAVFALQDYAVSDVVETLYGFHVLRRAPRHRVSASHILVQYKGSERAKATVRRTKDEARARAQELQVKASAAGANFAQLARENSDGPTGPRGGDLGAFGYEGMVGPFSEASFQMPVGGTSQVVETPFGFHVIRRTK